MVKGRVSKAAAVLMSIVMWVVMLGGIPEIQVKAAYENTHVNTGNQAEDIVAVAETQIGYKEGANNDTKYNRWNGKISGYPVDGYGYPWCHCFVSWCANQAGISTSIIPRTAGTSTGRSFFVNQGTYKQSQANGGSYVPKRGDIIYFGSGSSPSHVGIVSSCDGSTVHTIEGNYSDGVGRRSIALSNSYIIGYGVPKYSGGTPAPSLAIPTISTDKSSYNIGDTVYLSWTASPAGSNLSHYWLNVIAPDGTWVYGGTMNKETSYSFVASQSGNYSVTTYATPIGSKEGEGSLTDSASILVVEPKWYDALTPTNLGDSFYARIRNQSTNWYFTADNGNVEGQNAVDSDSQIWKFERQSDGSYKIINKSDGGCMDVYDNAKTGNDSNVQIFASNDGMNQRFYIYEAYDAYYIKPLCTDLLIDMAQDTGNVAVWAAGKDWLPQEFDIIKVNMDEYMPINLGDNFYARIRNQSTNWYFTANSGNIEGQNAVDSDSQLWKFERQSDGSYKIINKSDGGCMDVYGGAKEGNDSNVQTFTSHDGMNQRFYIYEAYDAYYIKPLCTDLLIDMAQDTGNVAVWVAGKDWLPQEFDIIKVNMDEYMPINLGDNFYARIRNQSTNWYFTANSGNVEGQNTVDSDSQLWKFERQSDGSYKIINKSDGGCMDVYGGAKEGNDSNVQTFTSHDGMNQRFYIYEAYDAYYIKPLCTDLLIDMAQDTGNVAVWVAGKDWLPQEFDIVKVDINKIKGDVNADKQFTVTDAIMLQKYILNAGTVTNWQAGDLNNDGILDIFDLALLKRMLIENK